MSPRAREREPRGHELPSGNTMLASCKHRNQARQGACGACFAAQYCEVMDLELKLQEACGLALETGRREAGLERIIEYGLAMSSGLRWMLTDAQVDLQAACGFAFDTGRRVAGLEMFIERQVVRR